MAAVAASDDFPVLASWDVNIVHVGEVTHTEPLPVDAKPTCRVAEYRIHRGLHANKLRGISESFINLAVLITDSRGQTHIPRCMPYLLDEIMCISKQGGGDNCTYHVRVDDDLFDSVREADSDQPDIGLRAMYILLLSNEYEDYRDRQIPVCDLPDYFAGSYDEDDAADYTSTIEDWIYKHREDYFFGIKSLDRSLLLHAGLLRDGNLWRHEKEIRQIAHRELLHVVWARMNLPEDAAVVDIMFDDVKPEVILNAVFARTIPLVVSRAYGGDSSPLYCT
jgi:hypothetical protein